MKTLYYVLARFSYQSVNDSKLIYTATTYERALSEAKKHIDSHKNGSVDIVQARTRVSLPETPPPYEITEFADE